MNETRTIWLSWAFGFLTVYGALADRRFLLGAAAVAAVLTVRDLAAFRRRLGELLTTPRRSAGLGEASRFDQLKLRLLLLVDRA